MKRLIYIGWVFAVVGILWGTVLNESFEIPDPNDNEWFIPPLHWTRLTDNQYEDCYAGIHSEFVPRPQYDRNRDLVHWNIPGPVDGSRFVVLSTGDLGLNSDSIIDHAAISQVITFEPGQRLTGYFFFGTCDFLHYNDYGTISLFPVDPNSGLPEEIVLAYKDVMAVGDYGSMEDWEAFSYDFTASTAGTYELTCAVYDIHDTIYKSYLAVDGLRLCSPLWDKGDINMDCSIDLTDLFILSSAWLSECPDPNAMDGDPNTVPVRPVPPGYVIIPDPNYMSDPNCPCEISDLDGNYWVDHEDLRILTDNWLENGYKQP